MSNVAKLKKRAVEFEQKRQYDKALAEYLKVLEEIEKAEDEVDVSLYNRVGDLMLRQSSVAEAVVYYEKAVDLYAEGGFFNNAIALCNKILRQAPGRHIIYYKLGKISAQKGFKSDAKQNFLEYADRMQQAGQIDEAFRALKEFADLCPDQDDIRLMLAEQLSRSDRKEEALEQLQSLYDKFEMEGRRAEARATVDRMKAIDPDIELLQKGVGVAPPVAKSGDLIFLDVDEAGPGGFRPSRGSSAGQRRPSAATAAASAAAAAAVPPPAPAPPPKPIVRALADIPLLEVDFDAAEAAEQADWSSRPTVQSSAVDLPSVPPSQTRPSEPLDLEPTLMDTGPELLEVEGLEQVDSSVVDAQPADSLLGFEPTGFDTIIELPAGGRTGEEAIPELEGFDTGRESVPSYGSSLDEGDLAIDEALTFEEEEERDVAPQDLPMLDLSESAPPSSSDLPFLLPDDVFGRPMETEAEAEPERHSGELLDDLVPPVSRRGSTPLPMLDIGDMDLGLSDAAQFTPRTEETEVPEGGADLPLLDVDAEDTAASPRATSARDASGMLDDGLLDLGEDVEPPPEAEEPRAPRRSSGFEAVLPEVLSPEPGEVTPAMLDLAAELDVPVAEFEAADSEPPPTAEEPPARRPSRTVDEVPTRRLTGAPQAPRPSMPTAEFGAEAAEYPALEAAQPEASLPEAAAPNVAAPEAAALEALKSEAAAEAPAPEAPAPEAPAPRSTAPRRASRGSIALPAILAADAAQQSVDDLREKLKADTDNGALRRSFAEALLESGERDAGLRELELALGTFEKSGDLTTADSVVEEILRVNPSSIRHYQKRVEIAFRLNERPRLVEAYIQLADGLFRSGQADKSRAVYQRVLDLAPNDARARAGIETFGEQEEASAPAAKPATPERRPSAETTKKAPTQPAKAKAPAPEPASNGGEDFVDLGEWLRDDVKPKSTRMVVEEKEPTGDEQADFADMLKKFKQGVAANVEDEDYDSHYDLGIAYKEMGLVDEAISQFQKALRGSNHRLRAYESLGYCFMEKQQYQVASTVLQRAVHEPGLKDDHLVGVLYMLGEASEALGQHSDAVQYYQRVFAVDIDFQDVSQRLNKLEKVGR